MKTSSSRTLGSSKNRGVAIIIVLSFVVLLSGLVVAFFSRALVEQQVSTSSVNQTKADILAGSAVDIILANLKKEIAEGSNIETYTGPSGSTENLYFPKNATDAVPKRSGANSGAPNLIRRSMYLDALPVSDQASNLPSYVSTSYIKRQISPERWNAHYFIPLSATNIRVSTPNVATFNNIIPSWILLQGATSGAVQPVVVTGTGDPGPSNVIGRYAYAIYDEGGLLDANYVGYPSASTVDQYSRKDNIAYADLSVLPNGVTSTATTAATTLGVTPADNLVAWRNNVTATGASIPATIDVVKYHTYVTGSGGRDFLKVSSGTSSGGLMDQMFPTRQALIKQWKDNINPVGIGGISANKTPALQYLATFTRSFDQPSLRPDPARPKSSATGIDSDNTVNPSFLQVRVEKTFKRDDGTNAVLGEPLVKRRFGLSKISLVGGRNPTATEAQALDYFGLTLTGGVWVYNHGDANRILTLDEVAKSGREPDFFEMLKAGITAGAIGQTSLSGGGTDPYVNEVFAKDSNKDVAIIQIGANIIDQWDEDSFPTTIKLGAYNLYGVENVPYLYRLRNSVVKVASSTYSGNATAVTAPIATTTLPATGAAVMFLQPEVWNPHLQTSPINFADTHYPTGFRFVVDSATVQVVASSANSVAPMTGPILSSQAVTGGGAPAFYNNYAPSSLSLDSTNNGIAFRVTAAATVRDPILLAIRSVPSTMSPILANAATNLLVTQLGVAYPSYVKGSGNDRYVTSFQQPGSPVTATLTNYIGVYLGVAPLSWLYNDGTNGSHAISAEKLEASSSQVVKCRMEWTKDDYTSASAVWYPYDEKIIPKSVFGSQSIQWLHTPASSTGLIGTETWASSVDPRTSRFGMVAGNFGVPALPVLSASLSLSTNATGGLQVGAGSSVEGLPTHNSWSPRNWATNKMAFADLATNRVLGTYYADPDGVVRRASGAFGSAPDLSGGATVGRPVILNRAFRNVGELGYVFSGIPWRNLDVATQESGFAGLLDVFCIYETTHPDALVAGKVDLNTQQAPVIRTILKGAYYDGITNTVVPVTVSGSASLPMTAFTSTDPLRNISELVGKWVGGSGSPIDGSAAYKGVGTDISNVFTGNNGTVERLREAAVRPLAAAGQTRVWNLMIDVIAQVGRYPVGAKADDYRVEGEQRYWVHVAIDRLTGEVIDKQIEVVQE